MSISLPGLASGPAQSVAAPGGRAGFILLLVVMLACAWGGGSYRGDLPQLLVLRSLAAMTIGLLLWLGADPRRSGGARPLWALLAAMAAFAALQLVPLPPALWTRLPGHRALVAAAPLAGLPQPWRPISVVPDATWNSLACLLVPAAVLLGCRAAGERRLRLLPWAIGIGCASALLGLVQLGGGRDSPFHLYPGITDPLPVGLLANRNHQGLLLASVLPLLAAWTWPADPGARPDRRRLLLAGAVALVLLPTILATGSRSGLVLTVLGGGAAVALLPWRRIGGRDRTLVLALAAALPVAITAAALIAGRALVLDRLAAGDDLSAEMRVASMPTVIALLRAYLPFGTGFGTFDPVFRMMEPDRLLTPTYRNHAHNDLLELVMTGGVVGAAILLAFLVWLVRAAARIRRLPGDGRRALGLAALACVALALLASLTDYPLRTPLMQAWFALCCAWIAAAAEPPRPAGRSMRTEAAGTGAKIAFSRARR